MGGNVSRQSTAVVHILATIRLFDVKFAADIQGP